MLKAAILAVALQLQAGPIWGHYEDLETIDQYKSRLETISEAIVIESAIESTPNNSSRLWYWNTESLALAVLVTWYYESRFDYRIHAGLRHPRYNQDRGRARCLGQIHVGIVDRPSWIRLVGTDIQSTRRCANATIKVLSRWFYRCKYKKKRIKYPQWGYMIGIFGGYKSGRGCWSAGNARIRAHLWKTHYQNLLTKNR